MRRRRLFAWLTVIGLAVFSGAVFVWALQHSLAQAPTLAPAANFSSPSSGSGSARIRFPSSPGETPSERPAQLRPVESMPTLAPPRPVERSSYADGYAAQPGNNRYAEYPVRRASNEVPLTARAADVKPSANALPQAAASPYAASSPPAAMPPAAIPPAPISAAPAAAAPPAFSSPISPHSPIAGGASSGRAATAATPISPAPPSSAGSASPTGSGRPGEKSLEGTQQPMLLIEKLAPPEIQIGKPAAFEIHVRNAGQIAATDVEVNDLIPQGTQLIDTKPAAQRSARGELMWKLGTMRPGDETVLHLELMPTAEGEIGSVATVRFSAGASARTICTRPELTVNVDAPRKVLAGDDVPLRIRVSNPGTGVATQVVLTEVVPANMEHSAGAELEYEIGDLQPNETRELDLTLRAVKPGQVLNLLHAQGAGKLATEVKTQIEVVAAELAVEVEGPKKRFLDRQATYTVSISNPGTAPAHEVELATYLPRGLQFVDANNAGEYDPQTHSVRWLLEELPPRERGSVSLTMMPIEPGQQVLRIESTADRNISAQKEETILVDGAPSIVFQVVDTADPINVGGETTYEILVSNQGSKEATNVQLSVNLPVGLQAVDAAGPTRFTLGSRQVQFQPIPQLSAKSETRFEVRVQCTGTGDHRCQVQLTSDDMRTPVIKEEGTRGYADE